MDGNGRWADGRGLPRIEGHRKGAENVRTILRAVKEFDIRYLTLFAFSVENWQRPSHEVAALMSLLEFFLDAHQQELIENQIRLHIIGCTETLPESVQKRLHRAVQATAHFKHYQLNLALSYGARTIAQCQIELVMLKVGCGLNSPMQAFLHALGKRFGAANDVQPDLVFNQLLLVCIEKKFQQAHQCGYFMARTLPVFD